MELMLRRRELMANSYQIKDYLRGVEWTLGQALSDTGAESANSSIKYTTNIIPLKPAIYRLTGVSGNAGIYYRVHSYDANGDWISMLKKVTISSYEDVNIVFEVPQNAYGIRLNVQRGFEGTLMAVPKSYPVGTDIVETYIRAGNHWQQNYIIDSAGDFVANGTYYASDIYIPVSPNYSYTKNENRIGNNIGGYGAWYDANKQFISTFKQDNLNVEALPQPPANAAYLRICTRNISNADKLTITRTA